MKIPETAKTLLNNMISALDAISMQDEANDLRKLRDDLDSQSTYIFNCEDEFESRTRFVNVIMQYREFISRKEYEKYFYSINIQKQLMRALRKAKKNPKMEKEAKNVIGFIQEAPESLWADCEDRHTLIRNFKLITDPKALNKISSELREMLTDSFQGIRIFYKYESVLERIRREKHLREWKRFAHKDYVYGTAPLWVFEWWYGLHDTGTYYIYVPKN